MCGRIIQKRGEVKGQNNLVDFVDIEGSGSALWGVQLRDNLVINARIENLDSHMWRRLIPIAIPVQAFVEKNTTFEVKSHNLEGQVDCFLGGLFVWGSPIARLVVVTQPAIAPVSKVHNRMPVIMKEAGVRNWLRNLKVQEHHVPSIEMKAA